MRSLKYYLLSFAIAAFVVGLMFYLLSLVLSTDYIQTEYTDTEYTDTEYSEAELTEESALEVAQRPKELLIPSFDRGSELENVFEAVFKHLFEHNASGQQQTALSYFLSIENEDPSADFLDRFSGHTPAVEMGSEFEEGAGLLFRVSTWEWLPDNRIYVTGGYHEANLSGSGNRYILSYKSGHWVVESSQLLFIANSNAWCCFKGVVPKRVWFYA